MAGDTAVSSTEHTEPALCKAAVRTDEVMITMTSSERCRGCGRWAGMSSVAGQLQVSRT